MRYLLDSSRHANDVSVVSLSFSLWLFACANCSFDSLVFEQQAQGLWTWNQESSGQCRDDGPSPNRPRGDETHQLPDSRYEACTCTVTQTHTLYLHNEVYFWLPVIWSWNIHVTNYNLQWDYADKIVKALLHITTNMYLAAPDQNGRCPGSTVSAESPVSHNGVTKSDHLRSPTFHMPGCRQHIRSDRNVSYRSQMFQSQV